MQISGPPSTANPPPRPGLVWPLRVDPTGLVGPTEGQSRGGAWRRSSRGLFVPSSIDPTCVEQRIVEAAAVLPDGGGLTGWAALRWEGGVWFDGIQARTTLPVDLATGYSDIRSQQGFVVNQERLHPGELHEIDGVPTTHAARSLCFMLRYAAGVREATVAADMAAYSDLVSWEEAAAYCLAHPGWTGIPQARRALALSEENSWSPWETRLRLVWVLDAGLAPPLCNQPIFDTRGRHIATPDLLDVVAGVAGEYDGDLHLEGHQRVRDVARSALLRRHGIEDFTVLAADMADRELVVRRILEARSRARFEPESRRSWTIRPPAWWTASHTVDLRRGLDLSHPAHRIRRRVSS